MSQATSHQWYRQPWAWFNIILLVVASVSAVIMSVVAIQHSPAEIGSRWYKDGVLAKRERQQEVLIQRLHLQGNLDIKQDGQVTLKLQYDDKSASVNDMQEVGVKVLHLYIEHPVTPSLDQTVLLTKVGKNQYSGRLQSSLSGKRRLLISPTNDLWYLTTQAYFPAATTLVFTPDVS